MNFLKKNLTLLWAAVLVLNACSKKNEDLSLPPVIQPESKAYLKLENADELNTLIDEVAKMSDVDYQKWKSSVGLTRTLYDRFVAAEVKLLEQNTAQVSIADSTFFYTYEGQLRSKNGLLLDKVLNETGVIGVGNMVIRYENGNVYFVSDIENTESIALLINKNITATAFDNKNGILSAVGMPESGNAQHQNESTINATDLYITLSSSGQQSFNYVVYSRRHDGGLGGKRRHWIDLNENYTIIPIAVSGSHVTWSVTYRFYMQFTQQKKVLFSWNVYPSKSFGHFFFKVNMPDWSYYPGGITGVQYGLSWENHHKVTSYGAAYTPALSETTFEGVPGYFVNYETVSATHPTYTIYRSDASQSVPTSGNLGSPIVLKRTQMGLRVLSSVFDVGENYIDHYSH